MKKLIIALVALTLGFGAQAQLRTSRTFVKSKSRTEWIIRAGLSINKLNGLTYEDEDVDGVGCKTGFDINIGFNKYMGSTNLYWGMELGIGTRGTSFEAYDDYYDKEMKGGISAYNVKWSPFTIGYKYAIGDMLKIDPHLGLYASYDFSSSSTGDLDDLDSMQEFDAGIQAGVGVWYGRFNLDFMYQAGFVNSEPSFYHECFDGGKTGNFLIRVGVSF